ncbi:MAG: anaerobic ribonucleoside-triphosphate reductase [Sulfurospirillum sp.]|jgi:anaerobic ribonucleoside-triphosphate reductase
MSREEILAKLAGKRTRCMVYTRVMGYHRPVESFNVGKTGEHRERVQFEESACSRKCS